MVYVIKIPLNEFSQAIIDRFRNGQIDAGVIHNFLKLRGQRILEEADKTKPQDQHVKVLDSNGKNMGNGVTVYLDANNNATVIICCDEPITGSRKTKADMLQELNTI